MHDERGSREHLLRDCPRKTLVEKKACLNPKIFSGGCVLFIVETSDDACSTKTRPKY